METSGMYNIIIIGRIIILVKLVNDLFNHVTGDDKEEHNYFNKVINQVVGLELPPAIR